MQKIPPFMVSVVNLLSLRMNPPGIQYLLKNSYVTRVIWSILVILALMSAAIFATNIFSDWKGERTITNLKTISKPVTELDFPSVTIFKDGQSLQAVREALEKQSGKQKGSSEKRPSLQSRTCRPSWKSKTRRIWPCREIGWRGTCHRQPSTQDQPLPTSLRSDLQWGNKNCLSLIMQRT